MITATSSSFSQSRYATRAGASSAIAGPAPGSGERCLSELSTAMRTAQGGGLRGQRRTGEPVAPPQEPPRNRPNC
jgi:hypothetical protein